MPTLSPKLDQFFAMHNSSVRPGTNGMPCIILPPFDNVTTWDVYYRGKKFSYKPHGYLTTDSSSLEATATRALCTRRIDEHRAIEISNRKHVKVLGLCLSLDWGLGVGLGLSLGFNVSSFIDTNKLTCKVCSSRYMNE
jgi:hypothetical protein